MPFSKGFHVSRHSNEAVFYRAELARALAETEWGDKTRRYFLNRDEEHIGGLKAATAIWCVLHPDSSAVAACMIGVKL